MVKKVPHTSPSTFDYFASHLRKLLGWASMGYFLHHLDPDIRKNNKTQTSSREDFEKETILGLKLNTHTHTHTYIHICTYIYIYIYIYKN